MWFQLWPFCCVSGGDHVLVVINSTGVLVQTSRRRAPLAPGRTGKREPRLQLSGPSCSCNACCLCKITIGRTSSLPLVNDTRAPIPVRHTCLVPWWLQNGPKTTKRTGVAKQSHSDHRNIRSLLKFYNQDTSMKVILKHIAHILHVFPP